ncbi:MAG TPA: FlgD immunoglobulin-like domain containing protein [Bacteroidota bacterium]|nr:FlgD immunoglobulin-like domain containing protein [Bacteroidota bacterium]
MRRVLYATWCFAMLSAHCLTAQPRSTRSDITVRALGTVGSASVRIRRDPASGNFYVMQNDGNIYRVVFGPGGLTSDTIVYRQSDHRLNHPLGMTFGSDGTMYLVGNDSTGVLGTATVVKGVPDAPGSERRTWSIIANTVAYPYGHVYNHRMSGIILSPGADSLYVNSGAATDHGELREGNREVGLTSIILKLPVNGQTITLQNDREWLRSNGYLLAEGIRNTFDFAYAGNGDLFGVENSGDRDDPDELNWIREGHHYGFPWRIGGNNTPQQFTPYDPRHDPLLNPASWGGGSLYTTFSNDPTYPAPPAGVTFTEPVESAGPDADRYRDTATGTVLDASSLGRTITTFTGHRSPDGIVFDRDSVLAGDLKGGGFVISLATGVVLQALGDTSQDLLHLDLSKSGSGYAARITRIVSGFNSPLGIEMAGNAIYVLETGLEGTNSSPKLWKVTLPAGLSTSAEPGRTIPNSPALMQNYPNPFNPSTRVDFSMPASGAATLIVYDLLGRQVRTLVSGVVGAGLHSVEWDGKDSRGMSAGSGVYFYRLSTASNFTATRSMICIR